VETVAKPLVLRLELSSNFLISGRCESSSWSHEFENVREDIWTGFVDTDTRVRSLCYDPPAADSSPIQPSIARSAHHLE
jgi:hypothetical protein